MIEHANVGVMILSGVAQSSYLNNEECVHHRNVFHAKLKIKQEKYLKLMLASYRELQTRVHWCITDQFITNWLNEQRRLQFARRLKSRLNYTKLCLRFRRG